MCFITVCVLLLQDLLQSCSRGGGRRVEDMCYERRRAEACVDESAHHALVNAWVCVFYYCRTYYKAVRVGGGGEWRTCAMRDDEPWDP